MSVHVDCDTCLVRGLACHDCVVTVLLGPPPELSFDAEEQQALEVLASSGLVPPLRMVTPLAAPEIESACPGADASEADGAGESQVVKDTTTHRWTGFG